MVSTYFLYGRRREHRRRFSELRHSGFSKFTAYQTIQTPTVGQPPTWSASRPRGTTTLSSATTIQALKISTGRARSSPALGSGSLTITSGGLITGGGNTTISTPLSFNGVEGVIFNASGTLTLSGTITTANGLTFGNNASSGMYNSTSYHALTNTANSFSGPITVNNCYLSAVLDAAASGGSSAGQQQQRHHAQRRHPGPNGTNAYLGSSRTITLGASGGVIAGTVSVYSPIVARAFCKSALMPMRSRSPAATTPTPAAPRSGRAAT